MKLLLTDIRMLWKKKLAFKLAAVYLLLFFLIAMLLPVLSLPYSPNELDLKYVFQPPFATDAFPNRHILGTDALGRDVLVSSLYGARTALFISFPVMILTSVLGLILGAAAGYFGDNKFKVSWAGVIVAIITIGAFLYYALYVPLHVLSLKLGTEAWLMSLLILTALIAILFVLVIPLCRRLNILQQAASVPLDWLVMRLIELFTSIPKLIFILVLAAFAPPSVIVLAAILILTTWTETARMARAEMLRVKQLPYFEAATSLGVSEFELILRHALPNIVSPVLVTFVFGLAGILALESTLSFLGVGASGPFISWGGIISGIRSNTSAWWLVVFPGILLTVTVLSLQTCSYYIMWAMQQRKR